MPHVRCRPGRLPRRPQPPGAGGHQIRQHCKELLCVHRAGYRYHDVVGEEISISGEYPAWEYVENSKVRDIMVDVYKEIYGKEPIVEGIHAGLECGIFSSKLEGLDCISFGPQMHDIHTTKEVLSIASTERTWELLLKTLERLK